MEPSIQTTVGLRYSVIEFVANGAAKTEATRLRGATPEFFIAKIADRITENIDLLSIEFERQVPELERLIKETESGEIEYRRQDGFYVSLAIDELNRISVKHPRLVMREEAAFVVKLLSILDDNTVGSMLEPFVTNYFKNIDGSNESLPAAISALKKMINDSAHQLKTLSDSSRESSTGETIRGVTTYMTENRPCLADTGPRFHSPAAFNSGFQIPFYF